MIKLFFSYSHKDEDLRNELDKHLSILKRQGLISVWHDRCILGGSELDQEINAYLKSANIILLLVSSDFLASDYCYDKEMNYAMEMHQQKKAVVLPVILRPCDWYDTPFGKLLATPKDGKPVIKFATLDEAFLDVTNEIKRIAKVQTKSNPMSIREAVDTVVISESIRPIRSSNLRIKKIFSVHDRDKFLEDAFEYMKKYFEGSLEELQKRNSGVRYTFKRIDSQTITASIYISGNLKTECVIFYGNNAMLGREKSINFSYSTSHFRNTTNESLSVHDDGYNLYLSAVGMFMTRTKKEMLTFEGASEYYWEMFIQRLQ